MFPILAATAIATPENVTDPAPKTEKREDTHSSESLVEKTCLRGKPMNLDLSICQETYGLYKGLASLKVSQGWQMVTWIQDFLWRSSPYPSWSCFTSTMNHPDYQRQGARPSAGGNLTSIRWNKRNIFGNGRWGKKGSRKQIEWSDIRSYFQSLCYLHCWHKILDCTYYLSWCPSWCWPRAFQRTWRSHTGRGLRWNIWRHPIFKWIAWYVSHTHFGSYFCPTIPPTHSFYLSTSRRVRTSDLWNTRNWKPMMGCKMEFTGGGIGWLQCVHMGVSKNRGTPK